MQGEAQTPRLSGHTIVGLEAASDREHHYPRVVRVVYGGLIAEAHVVSTVIYFADSALLEWTEVDPQRIRGQTPKHTYGHCGIALDEHRMLIVGGVHTDGQPSALGKELLELTAVHVFNLKTLTWTAFPANLRDPIQRYMHSMVSIRDGEAILVLGGLIPHTQALLTATEIRMSNQVYILHTDNMTWQEVETIGEGPPAVYGHQAVLLENRYMFVFGGRTTFTERSLSDHVMNDLYVLDTAVTPMLWQQLKNGGYVERLDANLPVKRGLRLPAKSGHSATVMDNGDVMFWGGWNSMCDNDNSVYVLRLTNDFAQYTWTLHARLSNDLPRRYSSVQSLAVADLKPVVPARSTHLPLLFADATRHTGHYCASIFHEADDVALFRGIEGATKKPVQTVQHRLSVDLHPGSLVVNAYHIGSRHADVPLPRGVLFAADQSFVLQVEATVCDSNVRSIGDGHVTVSLRTSKETGASVGAYTREGMLPLTRLVKGFSVLIKLRVLPSNQLFDDGAFREAVLITLSRALHVHIGRFGANLDPSMLINKRMSSKTDHRPLHGSRGAHLRYLARGDYRLHFLHQEGTRMGSYPRGS